MNGTLLPDIDPDFFDEVWSADLDVLESLEKSGDQPWVPRLVDVSFRGSPDALTELEIFARQFGFSQLDDVDGNDPKVMFIGREQTADVLSIKELTKLSLQFEALFKVELDGWGCVAQTSDGERI